MNVSISAAGDLTIRAGSLALSRIRPVLNGAPIESVQVAVLENTLESGDDPRRAVLRFTSPALQGGTFGLEIVWEPALHRCGLHWWIEQFPGEMALLSFGVSFEDLNGFRAVLRSGYHSWDGSQYVGRDSLSAAAAPIVGYALTQLLPESGPGSVVCGFDRHDRFQQTFTFAPRDSGSTSLTVLTHWDEKARESGQRCESERLLVFEHPGVEEALREWAHIVAAASPIPPRHVPDRITGWCSWYNLYASITEENIREHLHGAAAVCDAENLPLRIFQIDDGFTPERGDWLDVSLHFPRGMKPLLDEIRAAGFVPGLWIAPFVVGNRSRLYQEHPDWVVQDHQTGGPLVQMRFYGEFRWHRRSEEYYILDATHPAALDYLRRVFQVWRHEWGCDYFKADFMFFGAEYGPERARWYTPGLTRIEVWRTVIQMIREEIGDAILLGCGCPLWASVGLVDAVRIGRDVGVKWAGDQSAQALLSALMLRNFASPILWQADPDCVLLRSRFHHLTDDEIRSLALYAGMSGGVLTTSDALHELPPERLELLRRLLAMGVGECRYPLLGQTEPPDPVVVQVRDGVSLGGETLTACIFLTRGMNPFHAPTRCAI